MITSGAFLVNCPPTVTAVAGKPTSWSCTSTGDSNTTWFGASNNPSGVSLSPQKGLSTTVFWTPVTPGTFIVTVDGADQGGTAFASTSVIVSSGPTPVTLPNVTLPTGTQNQPYNFTINAAGGKPPYTYSETGALPAGVSLDPQTGTFSGTPTVAGTFPFTEIVTDSQPSTAMQSYTLVINTSTTTTLMLSDNCLVTITVDIPITCTLTVSGGTPPYTVSETGLTAGLMITGTTIFGTPTQLGPFNALFTVTDSKNVTGTLAWSGTVTSGSGGCGNLMWDTSSPLFPWIGGVVPFAGGLGGGQSFVFTLPNPLLGFTVDQSGDIDVPQGTLPGDDKVTVTCDGQQTTLDIRVNPGLASQAPGTTKTVGDPVDTATGEISERRRLLSLGGPLPLAFEVFYSTLLGASGFSGTMGNNWMHNFEVKLSLITNGVQITLRGGKIIQFGFSAGIWTLQGAEPNGYQLSSGSYGYQLLDPTTRWIYTFTNGGALSRVEDRNGNALTIAQGLFGATDVTDGLGRNLHFSYQGSKLMSVTDQSGRVVSFGYTLGALTSLIDATGALTNFTYTSVTGLANGLPPMTNLLVAEQRPVGNTPYTQSYDAQGNVSRQTDSVGNNTLLAYSTPGHATTVIDARGNTETDTNLYEIATTSITDANGNTTTFGYDGNLRRTSVKDRLGNVTSVTFHQPSGYPASVTDAQNNTTTFTYAAQTQGSFTFYNQTGVKFADGTSIGFTYDNSGNVLTATDEAGKAATYSYNSRGQVVTATNTTGGTTKVAYNPDATTASVQDPTGNITANSYDPAKRVTGITFADGTSTSFTYDSDDRLLSSTDERGNTLKYKYDLNGNLVSVTDALNKTGTAKYDTDDLLSSVTNPAGNTSGRQYDAVGNPSSATNGAGETYKYSYDALNRLTSIADPSGKGPSFSYDKEGRPISAADALSNVSTVTRDSLGRAVQATTPLNEVFALGYDSLGRLTSTTDPLSGVTSFSYDARGLLTGVTAPGGIAASYTRDDLGLLTSLTDPNGNTWTRKHDSAGRLTSEADPLGQTTSYVYDTRNRAKSITNPLGSIQMTYDSVGNLMQRKYSDATTLNFTYDQDNRITGGGGVAIAYDAAARIISSNGLTIVRDGAGRISSITYAQGKTVGYTYDSRGLLAKVSDWAGGSVTLIYDAVRRPVTVSRSNGITTQYTYDKDGRVTGIMESGTSSTLSSVTLQRDALGRVTSATRGIPQLPAPAPGVLGLTYNAANQISAASYDAMGRVTKDPLRTYTWNLASELTGISGADAVVSFAYDDFGQRISRTPGGGASESYVVNYATGLPSIATVKSAGADQRYYVYLPDGSLLYAIEAADNSRHFYHYDETGSTLFLTSDTGAITDSYGITAYGETVNATGTTPNPFTWMGRWGVMQEGSTGLFYMRARYYDSMSARFLSRDPLRQAGPRVIDPYVYSNGNPESIADPTGLKGSQADLSLLLPTINLPGAGALYWSDSLQAAADLKLGEVESMEVEVADTLHEWFQGFLNGEAYTVVREDVTNPEDFGELVQVGGGAVDEEKASQLVSEYFKPYSAEEAELIAGAELHGEAAGAVRRGLWYEEAGRAIVSADEEASRLSKLAGYAKGAGTALAVVGVTVQTASAVAEDVHNGAGVVATVTDANATVLANAAVLAAPPVAVVDALTGGSVSGLVHNALVTPNIAAQVVLTRTTSRDAAAIKRIYTRFWLGRAIWNLID